MEIFEWFQGFLKSTQILIWPKRNLHRTFQSYERKIQYNLKLTEFSSPFSSWKHTSSGNRGCWLTRRRQDPPWSKIVVYLKLKMQVGRFSGEIWAEFVQFPEIVSRDSLSDFENEISANSNLGCMKTWIFWSSRKRTSLTVCRNLCWICTGWIFQLEYTQGWHHCSFWRPNSDTIVLWKVRVEFQENILPYSTSKKFYMYVVLEVRTKFKPISWNGNIECQFTIFISNISIL